MTNEQKRDEARWKALQEQSELLGEVARAWREWHDRVLERIERVNHDKKTSQNSCS